SMEAVEIAVRKMQRALIQGSEENVTAEATFQSLGLSVEKLIKMKPDESFKLIASRIGEIQNPTARAGAALQVFGARTGTALLPMIEKMGVLTKQAKEFGLEVSTKTA